MTPEIKQLMREVAHDLFAGIAIPSLVLIEDPFVIEGEEYVYGTGINGTIKYARYAVCEKLLKFRRKKKKVKPYRHNPRMDVSAIDRMIEPVGKPGSEERIKALTERYAVAAPHEISPFLS